MNKNSKTAYLAFLGLTALLNIAANLAHPVTPTLIKNLNLGSYMFGVAFASMAFTQFLFSPFWGKMTTVIGERKQMLIGCLGYALAQFLFMISTTELGIILARLLAGLCMSAVMVASLTYVIRISPLEIRGRNLTYYTTITTVAATFGYLIGGVIGDFSVQGSFLLQVAMLILSGFMFFTFVLNRNQLQQLNRKEMIKEMNPFKSIFEGCKIMSFMLILLFIISFVASSATTAYDQSFNYYIKDIFNFKPSYNGYIKALIGIVSLIANMTICIWIQKKKDISFSLMNIFLICAISLFAITQVQNLWIFLSINIIFFATNSIYLPLIQNLCTQYSSDSTQGTIMGFYNSMKSLGMIIGALIAGFIYTEDPKLPFMVASAGFLISVLLLAYYLHKKKQSKA